MMVPARKLIVSGFLVAALGCGASFPEAPKTFPVEGKIVLSDGSPARFAVVKFEPVKDGADAWGDLDSKGNFTLRSSGNREGASPGEYKVVINPAGLSQKMTPAEVEQGKGLIPRKYWSESSTDLTATVEEKGNSFTFKLKS